MIVYSGLVIYIWMSEHKLITGRTRKRFLPKQSWPDLSIALADDHFPCLNYITGLKPVIVNSIFQA
jgi:hypothetical protein